MRSKLLAFNNNFTKECNTLQFVNSLVHISNPIDEYRHFSFVPWDEGIYPQFKGPENAAEVGFVFDIVSSKNLHRIADFAVGKGTELSGVIQVSREKNYELEYAEANEISQAHIEQARELFRGRDQDVLIHQADWLNLDQALPSYTRKFDFALLTGNSLALLGGGCRDYTGKAHQLVLENIANLVEPGGYLLIDHRNYDYIYSLMDMPIQEIAEQFTFEHTVYYHGDADRVIVFPAYISQTLIVLHYYDLHNETWSKLDYFPIFQNDIQRILNGHFKIDDVYSDFGNGGTAKSLFTQYLLKRI